MGKVKVKTKSKKPASNSKGKLIGSTRKHRTIAHLKYNAKGQRRRPGWK